YGQYSPQMNEKSGSASLALATVAILGQPPRRLLLRLEYERSCGASRWSTYFIRIPKAEVVSL
ncbi:MAG: hypothetical protein ABFS45_15835, partial [Pseudomonadota bacterium]